MSMTPVEARAHIAEIKEHLRMPGLLWANDPGPQGNLYRSVVLLTKFLEDALA